MKKNLVNRSLLIALLFVTSMSSFSQSHKMALSLTGGYVDGGFGALAALDYKVNDFDYLQFGVQTNFTKIDANEIKVPVSLYAFNAGFFFDVIRKNNRTFALALGAGATAGSETGCRYLFNTNYSNQY